MSVDRLDPALTQLHPDAFIARGAVVLGDVHVGAFASVWFGVVIRGDMAPIRIGDRTNIQDNSVVHVDAGCPAILGDDVTVGHACIVHGCKVGEGSLIGMGSVVMNRVEIGAQSLVGAGSLVTEGKQFPPRSLILGRPAKVVRALTDADLVQLRHGAEHYAEAGRMYRERGFDARGGNG